MVKPSFTTNHPPSTPCLSVLGTGSDVGKSIIATALCRIFSDMGIRVAPYKAQNMSNNSGVTPEGLEMGRAQIVQAEAARTPPHVDMNPILLKPTTDIGSQVILLGKAVANATARAYDLLAEYPDQIDGFNRLAMVYEARGEKGKAAEFYRKAYRFALSNEGFDQDSADWFLSEAKRMESENNME